MIGIPQPLCGALHVNDTAACPPQHQVVRSTSKRNPYNDGAYAAQLHRGMTNRYNCPVGDTFSRHVGPFKHKPGMHKASTADNPGSSGFVLRHACMHGTP